MRTKKANMVTVLLLTLIGIIITGLFVAWMVGFMKDKKQSMNTSSDKADSVIGSMADFDFDAYDGNTIGGQTLIKLINDTTEKSPELSIAVQTLVNAKKATPVTIYYNKALTTANAINSSGTVTTLNQSTKSSDNYITPTANFCGEVLKNSNNEVTGILFIQQK